MMNPSEIRGRHGHSLGAIDETKYNRDGRYAAEKDAELCPEYCVLLLKDETNLAHLPDDWFKQYRSAARPLLPSVPDLNHLPVAGIRSQSVSFPNVSFGLRRSGLLIGGILSAILGPIFCLFPLVVPIHDIAGFLSVSIGPLLMVIGWLLLTLPFEVSFDGNSICARAWLGRKTCTLNQIKMVRESSSIWNWLMMSHIVIETTEGRIPIAWSFLRQPAEESRLVYEMRQRLPEQRFHPELGSQQALAWLLKRSLVFSAGLFIFMVWAVLRAGFHDKIAATLNVLGMLLIGYLVAILAITLHRMKNPVKPNAEKVNSKSPESRRIRP